MKSKQAFRTISEVAGDLNVPQHVLRFWESKFNQLKPLKRGGNRRYYRPEDIELLKAIHQHLYSQGYTIKGVQRLLKDQGSQGIIDAAKGAPPAAVAPELPLGNASPAIEVPAPDSIDKKQIMAALDELKAIRALLD